jgi:hypothetical protein
MTVIMNKSDYIDKANTLLKDTKTYQPLDSREFTHVRRRRQADG